MLSIYKHKISMKQIGLLKKIVFNKMDSFRFLNTINSFQTPTQNIKQA